jgi:sterol desaturase/sphingolipid hydroxylase (fatty acid hydroxylase superfamily)
MQELTGLLATAGDDIRVYACNVLIAGTFGLALEVIRPASHHSAASRIRGALFWLVYIVITASCLAAFNQFWNRLGLQPLVTLQLGWLSAAKDIPVKAFGGLLALIGALTLGEFFYYWFHRLQHAVPFLWRFHAVHHSLREMNAWNSNHHFTEEIFRIPFMVIPTAILFRADPGYVPELIYIVIRLQGQFEHAATRFHLGPLRYVVADNRFHRIHHSIEQQHRDKNFGSFTPFWDMLFGTARFPRKNEWPETGLQDVEEPKTLADFLWRPFKVAPKD